MKRILVIVMSVCLIFGMVPDVFADDEPEGLQWEYEATMPIAKYGMATAAVGDKIYIFGGRGDRNTRFDSVDIYDTTTKIWSTGASMPTGRSDAIAVTVGEKIYVMGGNSTSYRNFECYDTKTDTWEILNDLPGYMASYGATCLDDKIYATFNSRCYEYNIDQKEWIDVGSAVSNYYLMLAQEDQRYYLQYSSNLGARIHYTQTDSWTGAFGFRWHGEGATVINAENKVIFTIGGRRTTATNINQCKLFDYFDSSTNTWQAGPEMLNARAFPGAVYLNGKVYVFGGIRAYSNITCSNIVESIDVSSLLPQAPQPTTESYSFIKMDAGEALRLGAIHGYDENMVFTWESSRTSVVTVDSTGKVNAVGSGKATINVTSADGMLDNSFIIWVNDQVPAINLQVESVNVQATTDTEITLSWDDVTDAEFYEVQFDGNTLTCWTNEITVSDLTPSTEYQFIVRACFGEQTGSWSEPVTVSTLPPAIPVNLALGSTASANSEYNVNYKANKAIDGDRTTATSRWMSAELAETGYFQLDFDQEIEFNHIDIYQAGLRIGIFELQYWNDEGWTTFHSGARLSPTTYSADFDTVTTSKVRLMINSRFGTGGFSIYEFEIYNL